MSPPPATEALDSPARFGSPMAQPTFAAQAAEPPRTSNRVPRRRPLQIAIGLAIVVLGSGVLASNWLGIALEWWSGLTPPVRAAWNSGWIAAGATAIGTLPLLLWQAPPRHAMGTLLGFSAGVMFAASISSLLIPAYQAGLVNGLSGRAALGLVLMGALGGAALLAALDRSASTVMAQGARWSKRRFEPSTAVDAARRAEWRSCALFVIAIVLHNIPEGLAMGVAHAGTDFAHARSLAMAIALQDLPEGLVVALALRSVGIGRFPALAAGIASGVVEPIASVLGCAASGAAILPWALALAAGAMLFAIAHEIVPLLRRHERKTQTLLWAAGGAALMAILDLGLT